MKNKNIVIFSSGVSENSGIVSDVCKVLTERNYKCSIWRNLFANAKDMNHIALLPMLIKKIPTFDYAVLICEGHDVTIMTRGTETTQFKTMRDNVLFEIGLCSMALGLNRTILVTDKDVRLPDDLTGVNNSLALKRIVFNEKETGIKNSADDVAKQIDEYIVSTGDELHQVVIGAAASSACGYVSNFLFRTLEHIEDDFCLDDKIVKIPKNKIFMHIILPERLNDETFEKIKKKKAELKKGTIATARSRPADFDYMMKGDELHIIDYPTNISTSYDTAKIILEMDADDTLDSSAADRFTTKELNLFESTLYSLFNENYIRQTLKYFYPNADANVIQKMHNNIYDVISKRLTIERSKDI